MNSKPMTDSLFQRKGKRKRLINILQTFMAFTTTYLYVVVASPFRYETEAVGTWNLRLAGEVLTYAAAVKSESSNSNWISAPVWLFKTTIDLSLPLHSALALP